MNITQKQFAYLLEALAYGDTLDSFPENEYKSEYANYMGWLYEIFNDYIPENSAIISASRIDDSKVELIIGFGDEDATTQTFIVHHSKYGFPHWNEPNYPDYF